MNMKTFQDCFEIFVQLPQCWFLGSMLPQYMALCVSLVSQSKKICVSVCWVTLWVRPPLCETMCVRSLGNIVGASPPRVCHFIRRQSSLNPCMLPTPLCGIFLFVFSIEASLIMQRASCISCIIHNSCNFWTTQHSPQGGKLSGCPENSSQWNGLLEENREKKRLKGALCQWLTFLCHSQKELKTLMAEYKTFIIFQLRSDTILRSKPTITCYTYQVQ